jgi:chaperonin cofactor prefoldin
MKNYIKVSGSSDFVRDPETLAILNSNRSDYENYLLKKQAILASQQEVQRHTEEINTIKEDLSEIKQMLTALIKDRKKG